jgi:hypothetical protein
MGKSKAEGITAVIWYLRSLPPAAVPAVLSGSSQPPDFLPRLAIETAVTIKSP